MARKASFGKVLAQWQLEYYSFSVCSVMDPSFLSIFVASREKNPPSFSFSRYFFKRKRKWRHWSGGEDA
jgi:hypothetical protein